MKRVADMDWVEINAIIESSIWPAASPVAPYVGNRGSHDERKAALMQALAQMGANDTDERHADLAHTELILFDQIDGLCRRLVAERYELRPERDRADHMRDIGEEVAARCAAWADMPNQLDRATHWDADDDDVPF